VALALALDLNQTRPSALSIAYRQRLPLFIKLLQAPVLAQISISAVLPEIESYEGLYATYNDPSKITLDAVRANALPLYQPGGRYALLKTAEEIIPANLSALIQRYPTIHQPVPLIRCAEARVTRSRRSANGRPPTNQKVSLTRLVAIATAPPRIDAASAALMRSLRIRTSWVLPRRATS
jgi:hypothetical protein